MRIVLVIFIAIVVSNHSATAQEKWSLLKCVQYAWANNISIKRQEIQTSIAGLNEQQISNAAYPNANFSTNTGLQFGRSIDPTTNQFTNTQLLFQQMNLSADVVIFNWHSVKNRILASRLNTKAAQALTEKAKNDIALMVATNFLQVLLNKEQVQIANIQFEQTKNQLSATRKRVAAGALPELNATELEAQLARDSTAVINSRATADISVLQLKALLNLDPAVPFDIEVPPVNNIPVEKISELQPDYVFNLALNNQPAQKANRFTLEYFKTNVKVAKAARYPVISGFVGLGTNFANPFKKVTGYSFNGYEPINPLNPAPIVNIGGINYPIQQPKLTVTQGSKSFGELWNGYGRQIDNNFRQNFGIAISVPIFSNGGSARTAYQRSKLDVKDAELVAQNADNQLKQDIYQAYTNANSALQRYNASLVTLATSQTTYEYAKKRHEVGLLSTFELITNQNNLNRAMQDKSLAQYEYVFRMKVLEFYKGQGIKL